MFNPERGGHDSGEEIEKGEMGYVPPERRDVNMEEKEAWEEGIREAKGTGGEVLNSMEVMVRWLEKHPNTRDGDDIEGVLSAKRIIQWQIARLMRNRGRHDPDFITNYREFKQEEAQINADILKLAEKLANFGYLAQYTEKYPGTPEALQIRNFFDRRRFLEEADNRWSDIRIDLGPISLTWGKEKIKAAEKQLKAAVGIGVRERGPLGQIIKDEFDKLDEAINILAEELRFKEKFSDEEFVR